MGNKLGVWVRAEDEADNKLLFVGDNIQQCQRFILKYDDRTISAEDWIITALPPYRVDVGSGIEAKTIAAFDSVEKAMFFTRDYIEQNEGRVDHTQVHIVYP